jgi:4-amino-4-deoxy-L-arabinose transferase-like glycosyltransferase
MTTLTAPTYDAPAAAPPRRSRLRRLWRGNDRDAAWVRPSLLSLLGATGLLYLWGLGASGWGNAFYSAAVQAGSHSWKAFFFGSFDSSNFITVDKPPASLWVMDISARIFGVNAWSILVPQALMGVATVGLVYATVRRRFSAGAALLAGGVTALTPVAVVMFRFNNPDALLVLLLVASAYAMVRALEGARTKWIVIAGALIGTAFLAKMMQAFLVIPGFGLVYLVAAPTALRRRIWQLLLAGVAVVVSAGWWVLAVTLTPAADRPYIGGSQHNSVWELIVGYNGLGRLTGQETGSVGGQNNSSGRWGATGLTRLFNSEMGGQISWLLPAALILMVALFVLWRRRPRIDGARAQVALWATWLVVTGVTFSLGEGIIHPYYTVALAPAIGALVGIGGAVLWAHRDSIAARGTLAAVVAVTAVWSYRLLDRSPSWHPWLRDLVVVLGIVAAAALLVPPRQLRKATVVVLASAVIAGLAGPAAYALDSASTPHTGSIPSAGPAVAGSGPGGGGAGGPGGFGQRGSSRGFGGQGFGGFGGSQGSTQPGVAPGAQGGTTPGGQSGTTAGGRGGTTAGGLGGLLNAGTASSALVKALQADSSSYTWVAATVGSNNAAGLQLGADRPVMSIGGFNGTDPTPTLAQFESYVTAGKIHYFVAGGGMGGGGGGFGGSDGTASSITQWVESHFTAKTIGGETVYDLTQPSSSSSTNSSASAT